MCIFVQIMADNKIRCGWCMKDDLYKDYHDKEWGRPSHDDKHIFEMIILESFQAGLSWYTILVKRENFRKAFDKFNPKKISTYSETKITELMNNPGIIRNHLKIKAAIQNASSFLKIQKEYGTFANYLWGFTDQKVIDNAPKHLKEIKATSKESDKMAKDLKKKGFSFMGSTTCYAMMQSLGMVNDHLTDCHCREQTK